MCAGDTVHTFETLIELVKGDEVAFDELSLFRVVDGGRCVRSHRDTHDTQLHICAREAGVVVEYGRG